MSAVATWAAALDDWEGFLDELAAALDAGDWETLWGRPAWQAPEDLGEPPTGMEEQRLLALADRAGRLRDRLELELRLTAERIGEGRSRHRATVAYLHGARTSPIA